jgi:hypothetical protein
MNIRVIIPKKSLSGKMLNLGNKENCKKEFNLEQKKLIL